METYKLTKTITTKGDKAYINFYLNIGDNVRIAIKPSFSNDFHILNKFAKLYKKDED